MARPVVFPHRRIALPVATLQSIESPLPPDLSARCKRAGRTGHSMAKRADPGKTASADCGSSESSSVSGRWLMMS